MTSVTQNTDNSEKIDGIIQAAQNVFGQYGFEKTSMNDIARELNYSKASLYYYFQDKESLFRAVIQKEQKEFLRLLKEIIKKPIPAQEQLNEYAILRHNYFSVFLNLSKLRQKEAVARKSFMHAIITDIRDQEIKLVSRIFSKGIEDKEFRELDPLRTTLLFMDLMKGLRIIAIRNYEATGLTSTPEEELWQQLKEFINLFLNGVIKK